MEQHSHAEEEDKDDSVDHEVEQHQPPADIEEEEVPPTKNEARNPSEHSNPKTKVRRKEVQLKCAKWQKISKTR